MEEKEIKELTSSLLDRSIDADDFKRLQIAANSSSTDRGAITHALKLAIAQGMLEDKYNYLQDKGTFQYRYFMEPHEEVHHNFSRSRFVWLAAAVAFLLIVPLCSYLYFKSSITDEPDKVSFYAPTGKMLSVTLEDGSRATLNPNTHFSFVMDKRGGREMTLDGEALIEVKHDISHPMTITTRGMRITDIGTVLRIKAYANERLSTVSLLKGTVTVNMKGTTLKRKMGRNECLHLDTYTHRFTVDKLDNSAMAADMAMMFFDNAPLSDVVKTLSRNYGVNVSLAANCTEKRFMGVFSAKDDSLSIVLEAIKTVNGVNVKKTRQGYHLY